MYYIKHLSALEDEFQRAMRKHFVDFFSKHDYSKETQAVVSKSVKTLNDVEATYSDRGFYVILTDYQIEQNNCTLKMGNLKAIYRGHCATVKKRLKSHLFNDEYRNSLPERGVRYDVCMKLDDQNGINISNSPYSDYQWKVVVHKMRGSSQMMRKQAELAFDQVFGRPLGSREAG